MQLLTIAFTIVVFTVVVVFSFLTGYNFHKFRTLRQINKATEIARRDHEGPHRHEVPEITQIINGLRYSSLDSKCIAQGSTMLGWAWLMQTNNHNYFMIIEMLGSQAIYPQTKEQAVAFHGSCGIREVPFEQAFPGVNVKDA